MVAPDLASALTPSPAPMLTPARRLRVADAPTVAVVDAGLACCALEVAAAVATGLLRPEEADDGPAEATVLVASGTVTTALAPAVRAMWAALPEPRAAVAFGACASTGGPYWDSPSIAAGLATIGVPVVAIVPGCPPSPRDLVAAIREAACVAEPVA